MNKLENMENELTKPTDPVLFEDLPMFTQVSVAAAAFDALPECTSLDEWVDPFGGMGDCEYSISTASSDTPMCSMCHKILRKKEMCNCGDGD